jgi:4-amino-4-deoxy-L-arabinose transferase-like glycosyltransferase
MSESPAGHRRQRYRYTAWIVLALVLLAFALRTFRLDGYAFRGDESFTVLFVTQPMDQLWDEIRNIEPNPPLYYLLLRGALRLWGESDWAARFLSAWFGVLAVPLIYRLGRALLAGRAAGKGPGGSSRAIGEWAPVLAALILAINPYQIWHSQDVRNYSVWPAISLFSLCFLIKALRHPSGGRPWLWVGYVVTALLSIYTHYYDAFSLLFQNAFVLLFYWRQRAILGRWIASQAVVALLFVPWLLFGSSRPLTYQAQTEVPGLPGMAGRTLSHFALGETIPEALASALLPAIALLAILGLVVALRRERHLLGFLVLYLAVPLLCVWLLAQWRPIFRERYQNVIAPGFYLAFALALAALAVPALTSRLTGAGARARRLGLGLAAVLGLALLFVPGAIALGNYYFDPAYSKGGDWRDLVAYLSDHVGPEDVIVQNYPDPGLAHYYKGPAERLVLPDRSAVDQVGNLEVDRLGTGRTLSRLLEEHERLWLLPYPSEWDPEGYVEGWLERRAHKVEETQIDVFRLVAYEWAAVAEPEVPHPRQLRLGEAVQLMGYDLEAEGGCRVVEAAGDADLRLTIADPGTCTLALTLYWRALDVMDENYTVFTHLAGAGSQIWAQHDGQPQGGGFPTREWFPKDVIVDEHRLALSGENVPPGPHVLEVGMYQLESNTRLPARGPEGESWPLDAVPLPVVVEASTGP